MEKQKYRRNGNNTYPVVSVRDETRVKLQAAAEAAGCDIKELIMNAVQEYCARKGLPAVEATEIVTRIVKW